MRELKVFLVSRNFHISVVSAFDRFLKCFYSRKMEEKEEKGMIYVEAF
jgi:hypothetical protein